MRSINVRHLLLLTYLLTIIAKYPYHRYATGQLQQASFPIFRFPFFLLHFGFPFFHFPFFRFPFIRFPSILDPSNTDLQEWFRD